LRVANDDCCLSLSCVLLFANCQLPSQKGERRNRKRELAKGAGAAPHPRAPRPPTRRRTRGCVACSGTSWWQWQWACSHCALLLLLFSAILPPPPSQHPLGGPWGLDTGTLAIDPWLVLVSNFCVLVADRGASAMQLGGAVNKPVCCRRSKICLPIRYT
jgi:hypothetical protein